MDDLKGPLIQPAHCAVSVIDDVADDAKFVKLLVLLLLYVLKSPNSIRSHILFIEVSIRRGWVGLIRFLVAGDRSFRSLG